MACRQMTIQCGNRMNMYPPGDRRSPLGSKPLISNALHQFAFRYSRSHKEVDDLIPISQVTVVACIFSVALNITAIIIVRQIAKAQQVLDRPDSPPVLPLAANA